MWNCVELCGIRRVISQFSVLNPFDHNTTHFLWNKHVELCGIMWNKTKEKLILNPLWDFDQNYTKLFMMPLVIPGLIPHKKCLMPPLVEEVELCGIMWNYL